MIAQPQIAHVIRTIPEIGSSAYNQASRFATGMKINDLARLPGTVLDSPRASPRYAFNPSKPVCMSYFMDTICKRQIGSSTGKGIAQDIYKEEVQISGHRVWRQKQRRSAELPMVFPSKADKSSLPWCPSVIDDSRARKRGKASAAYNMRYSK